MPFTFDKKLFLYLSLVFILFACIGTISHELGHYTMAGLLGYPASIDYNSTQTLTHYYSNTHHPIWITAAGPLQTLLFGTVGLMMLLIKRRNYLLNDKLNRSQWFWIFLSLFWLRELFNFLVTAVSFILKGSYPNSGDEMRLALAFGWPTFSLTTLTALIGLTALIFAFYLIPEKQRLTFLFSLSFGSLAGYFFWMQILGPLVMP